MQRNSKKKFNKGYIMPRSKATQEHVRSKVIDISQSGKSYKANSQAFGVQ